jgi:hypothetical protein
MRPKVFLVPGVLVLAVLLGACSGGGSGGGAGSKASTSTTTASASASSSPSTVAPTNDMAKAQKLVLVKADFPSTWTALPADQSQSSADLASEKEFNDCVGTSGPEAESARFSGDDISLGQIHVSSEAIVIKDDTTYKTDVTALKSAKVQTCVNQVFTKLLTTALGAAPTSVGVTPLDTPSHGDVSVGMRLTMKTAQQGVPITVVLDFVVMAKNRAETLVTFVSFGQPVSASLQHTVLDKLGKRVDAA